MEVPNKRANKSNDGVTFNKDVFTEEKSIVVTINRVTKVVKGGKRMSFNALVVLGNVNGSVGVGTGKSNEVQLAIMKGTEVAKKNMISFPLIETSIPHETIGHFGAGKVWMKPAVSGTGLIAGGGVRAVLEVAGVKNVLTKNLGTRNYFNSVYATMEALKDLKTRQEVLKLRGVE
ncbi:MAG: 30S ribosomal protein S5 [Elusimicrobia bacterium]|nr:30S ribosomal protein S5 [Elusimicrobiota bacterium]